MHLNKKSKWLLLGVLGIVLIAFIVTLTLNTGGQSVPVTSIEGGIVEEPSGTIEEELPEHVKVVQDVMVYVFVAAVILGAIAWISTGVKDV